MGCRVYVHDAGDRFTREPMADSRHRWADLDHNWHVAYWLHQGLLQHRSHTRSVDDADVIFVAHYFLHENPVSAPLFFGAPMLRWHEALRDGPRSLFNGSDALVRRYAERPGDFVVAPILIACGPVGAARWLDGARWIITESHFGQCRYRRHHDIIAPQVVSSDVWRPRTRREQSAAPSPRRARAGPAAGGRSGAFILYIGRLGKTYIEPPMSRLRFDLWSALRTHPNVTFLATDATQCVAPYLSSTSPPPCKRCGYGCKQCIELADGLGPYGAGVAPRIASKDEYRARLAASTFCLVLRGDNENSRKFTETVLSGCIPVLIADMPGWPFDSRLDYREFSVEFDWRIASADPASVVDYLLGIPAQRIAAMRRRLDAVRHRFFYHSDRRSGAVAELVADMCAKRRNATPALLARRDQRRHWEGLYNRRLAPMPTSRLSRASAERVRRWVERTREAYGSGWNWRVPALERGDASARG